MSSGFVANDEKVPSLLFESLSMSATACAKVPQSFVPSSTRSVDSDSFFSSAGSMAVLEDDGMCFIKLVMRSNATMSPV